MTSPLDTLRSGLQDSTHATPTHAVPASDTDWSAAIAEYQAKIDGMLAKAQEQQSKKPFVPHAAPGSDHAFYQVIKGDTLASIAEKLGLASPYHDLFQPNMAFIEAAARENGSPGGSDQGAVLAPGIYLEYRPVGGKTEG
jgi:hypothetical protein